MFRFEHTDYLYLLAAIPIIILLLVLARRNRKKALQLFGDLPVMKRLMPGVSIVRPIVKSILLVIAFLLMVFGIANPQMGKKMETVQREGVEIMIALDVSNSMMAEDIRPNRLEQAKLAIGQLIKRLRNDKLGLVVFAGEAYVQLPLTTDYSAARMFLSSIHTSTVPVQGTAIGAALELCLEAFGADTEGNKAMVLISDGENHEDDAIDLAKKAQEDGIQVHAIGIGSPEGMPIPIINQYGQKRLQEG